MTVAETLARAVRELVGSDLPVRIRAWDGSEAGSVPNGRPAPCPNGRPAPGSARWR